MGSKICLTCQEEKVLIDFEKTGNKWDKTRRTCKRCRAERKKEQYHTDVQFRLREILRKRLNGALRSNQKSGSAVRDLGCSIKDLKHYLESKFDSDMSWDNYGREGWHIDHIQPLASFDLTNRKQLLEAVHYTNLQPLWSSENFAKSGKTV